MPFAQAISADDDYDCLCKVGKRFSVTGTWRISKRSAWKVVLVGDVSVGKTHLLSRYMKACGWESNTETSIPSLHS